ncbi:MAG: acyl-CoA dehydrogenase, partial [Gammaproteobacteria bacterium]|nr:acyl-CoA dehydrogenase [Gammaproteobacteria bacterium]
MDIAYSAEDEAFRDEVRTFLDARLSDDMRRAAARTTTVFAD